MNVVKIGADQASIADDFPAGNEQMRDMRLIGAGEEEVDRLDRHDRVAVKAIEIEHEDVGGFSDFQFAASWRAVGATAVGDDGRKIGRALDRLVEAPAAVQEMTETHLAQGVVVFVKRRTIDAAGDAAAALQGLADRGYSRGEVKVRTWIGDDRRPRFGHQIEFFGPRIDAMGE